MLNTCIIGGNGFIGRHLVNELVPTGRNITIVSRKKSDEDDTLSQLQVESMFDAKLDALITYDIDEVICLAYATKPKTSFDNPIMDIEENLAQALHLFEIVSKAKRVKKLVYVSSGGAIYGNTKDDLVSEGHLTQPISPYGITKLAIEHYAHMFFTLYGLPIIIIRPSNAYGPGQLAREGQGFVAYAIQSVLKNKPVEIFGMNGTVRDYIYVKDLARALHLSLDKAILGATYNVGTQQGYSNQEILNFLKEIVDPERYTVDTKYTEERLFDVKRNVLNISKITGDTGWKPSVSIKDGLDATWKWMQDAQNKSR